MDLFRKKDIQFLIKEKGKLKRTLSTYDLTLLGLGAIIGTGIFVVTGIGALKAGPALIISFFVAAIACGLSAMSYAEFSSMVPISGSVYTYSYVTIGEFVAWLIGWDLILEYVLAVSSVAVGWSGYTQSLLGGMGIHLPDILRSSPQMNQGGFFNLPAFLIVMAVTFLLSRGITGSKKVNNIMVLVKICVILLFVAAGVGYIRFEHMEPFSPFGLGGVLSSAALVFYAYIGFDAVATAAEETRNPQQDLPKGILFSLGISTLLYTTVAFVTLGIVPFKLFEKDVNHPVSLALQNTGQYWISGIIDMGAIVGMTTVLIVMLYGQTRISFSMSRDGLLPKSLSRIDPKYKTPYRTTWLFGTLAATIGALFPLEVLSELINIGTLFAFSLVSVGIIILRKTHPHLNRTYRCPGVPYIPSLGILVCIGLMFFLQITTWITFLIWMAIGILFYFTYSIKHSSLN